MSLDEIYKDAKHRMEKTVEYVQHELARIRTGRATPTLLDGIKIEYYGTNMPLHQVASISAPEPRLLVIQPWEKKFIGEIEKAILEADLGLNPANDGNVVRIPIPELSEERRQDLLKLVKKFSEEGRIAIRNVRRDANDHIKKLEKNHDISEDVSHDAQDKIQNYTDKYIEQIDNMLAHKETEILEK
ncbi:ribosome recycling factor [Candidatus Saccharibacteria bacterium]|nr:ribosome recycling factor [Candidatus Saccharibacteria bacterium]NIV03084.1 ribosome recycling factor [Calditrichia bacterium]NIV72735.1 ribosome recycling factor [Calditrichia bacterium]NIV98095.1 ribosome recycling factor [Candidatus Saccharibacteria bacterium]NIW78382.1 ribosome recycling factor [Calditrichia bacterium]